MLDEVVPTNLRPVSSKVQICVPCIMDGTPETVTFLHMGPLIRAHRIAGLGFRVVIGQQAEHPPPE